MSETMTIETAIQKHREMLENAIKENPKTMTRILFMDVELGKTEKTLKGVAYIPSAMKTYLTKEGQDIVEPVLPPFMKHLKSGNFKEALQSIGKEIYLYLLSQTAVKFWSTECPVGVCANCPPGSFYYDYDSQGNPERIVLNESWAAAREIDADADRMSTREKWIPIEREGESAETLWTKYQAVCIKWPITKRVPVLNYQRGKAIEHFHSLTDADLKEWYDLFPPLLYRRQGLPKPDNEAVTYVTKKDGSRYVPMDEYTNFIKSHTELPIGMLDSTYDTMDLWEITPKKNQPAPKGGWPNLHARRAHAFTNPYRFLEIEKNNFKAMTKDNKDFTILEDAQSAASFNRKMDPRIAPLLTSTKQAMSGLDDSKMKYILNTNLHKLCDRVINLDLSEKHFLLRDEPTGFVPTPPTRVTEDTGLINRLIKHGRLRVQEVPHSDPKLRKAGIPMIILTATLPNGEPVAFTDVKRQGGEYTGLTYMFILPPVWDAEKKAFVHPLDHMKQEFRTVVTYTRKEGRKLVSRFDSCIINPTNGVQTNYFMSQMDGKGEYHDHFEKYPVKVPILQTAMLEYLGKYGTEIGAIIENGKLIPNYIGIQVMGQCVVIDYMKDMSAEEMYTVAREADSTVRLCISGNKQRDRRVRTYVVAHPNGTAILGPKTAHISRVGKQRSQLARATHMYKAVVCVCKMDTQTQVYTTPTGIEKQKTNKAFLPQTFNTKLEFKNHCKANNLDPETAGCTNTFRTWPGRTVKVWLFDPRFIAELGKSVDIVGNKFMPRRTPQCWYIEDGKRIPIDIMFPIHELSKKQAIRAFLGDTPPKSRRVIVQEYDESGEVMGERKIEVIIVEKEFFRTGSASENIPGRNRIFTAKGMDAQGVLSALHQLDENWEDPQPDLNYAEVMQMLGKQLIRMFPYLAPKEEE